MLSARSSFVSLRFHSNASPFVRTMTPVSRRFASSDDKHPHGYDRDRATGSEDSVKHDKHDKSPEQLAEEHSGGTGTSPETSKVKAKETADKGTDPQSKAK